MWFHVRTATPAFVGGRQPQANLVFEHMRRRIDLDVHGPPQGDAHRRAVWGLGSLAMHDVLSRSIPKNDIAHLNSTSSILPVATR